MVFRRTIYARESCAKSFANRIGHWTVAVFFALSIATPVAADVRIEENQNPRTIHISGKFLKQDFHRLDAMLEQMEKRRPLTDITVTLDSPGGAHFEGLRLGLLLHRKGIGTQIMPGATCFSACASIFFGGFDRKTGRPNRVAHEGSRLGVHRASVYMILIGAGAIRSDDIDSRVFAAARLYFADMRVSEKIWRMFKETSPDDMYIVTPSDMAESDITFVPASRADAQVATTQTNNSSSGSGIVIGNGDILTNWHVIKGCDRIAATVPTGMSEDAILVARDVQNDLAVIRVKSSPKSAAAFRQGASIRTGDAVLASGYPLSGVLASPASVSTGIVNALAGLSDDSRFIQISAPVQPGNSGGPLVDQDGHLVGIVISKLNAMTVARFTGDIPPNVNFAIKADVARIFLEGRGIEYTTGISNQQLPLADAADLAKAITAYIECRGGSHPGVRTRTSDRP